MMFLSDILVEAWRVFKSFFTNSTEKHLVWIFMSCIDMLVSITFSRKTVVADLTVKCFALSFGVPAEYFLVQRLFCRFGNKMSVAFHVLSLFVLKDCPFSQMEFCRFGNQMGPNKTLN
jgi:hypothetical protein